MALLLFLFCGALSAQGTAGLFEGVLQLRWAILLAVAIFIGYALAAIAYMLSSVFHLPDLDAWAKAEVGEVTGTVFLVAIIILLLGFSDMIFSASVGGTPMSVSSDFTKQISNNLMDAYLDGIRISMIVSLLSGAPPGYGKPDTGSGKGENKKPPPNIETAEAAVKNGKSVDVFIFDFGIIIFSYYGYGGAGLFLQHLTALQSLLLGAIVISNGLNMLLNIISELAIPVLMPLGVFMRCFSITRKMGSTMIAMAVGLYFFFPASIFISQKMYEAVTPKVHKPDLNSIMCQNAPAFCLQFIVGGDPLSMLSFMNFPDLSWGACLADWGVGCVLYPLWVFLKLVWWAIMAIIGIIRFMSYVATALAPGGATLFGGPFAGFLTIYYLNSQISVALTEVMLAYTPYVLINAVPVILMPFISLIVVVTAMRAISPAIGGEVQILGVSELI